MHRPPRSASSAPRPVLRLVLLLLGCGAPLVVVFADCAGGENPRPRRASTLTRVLGGAPDELPRMVNSALPFRYPVGLYEERVQGNVTLRLFVDSTGTVVGDSTRVEETSGQAALDSAAVTGSRALRFTPARRRGSPIAVSLLYPVYFRHPEAAPLPGDSVLNAP